MCLFFDSLCTRASLSIVMSNCIDLGPARTRSFMAWNFAFVHAGKHIEHLPSLALDVLLVPDWVWNHVRLIVFDSVWNHLVRLHC